MQFSLWKLFLHFFYFFQFLIYFFYSAFYAFVCNLHFSSFCSVPVDTVGRIPIFSFITPRLLGFSGAYSFFSFFCAPAARLLRGLFFLFLLLRPGCSASPGLFLAFPSSTPRPLEFSGAYSFFSFFYAPAARLLRGFFFLFLLLHPSCSASPGRILSFPSSTPRLLGFPGAYSYFSFFYAPAARLLRGVFFLFLLLRPGCSASPGLILTFPFSTPRLLGFLGAYSFFSFFYAPAARLPRGLFLFFLLLRPSCSNSPGLISYSDTHTVAFHGGQRLLSGLRSRWCSTREPWLLRGVVGSLHGDVRRNCCGHRR